MNTPRVPQLSSEPIELEVTASVAVRIPHGLGRQVVGWLVVWQAAVCNFYVQDPTADSSRELVLVPNATTSVRLVLL